MYVTNVYSCLCGASILFHDSFNKKWLDFTGHQQQEFQVPRNHHLENNPLRKFQHTVPPSNIPQTTQTLLQLFMVLGIHLHIFGIYFCTVCFFPMGFFRGSCPRFHLPRPLQLQQRRPPPPGSTSSTFLSSTPAPPGAANAAGWLNRKRRRLPKCK